MHDVGQTKMRCLYEVLGLPEDADETTIRKAYRKAALAWHPDKNQENLELADARFKEIQNAWEVLSDPREKAWYDSHRDQILRAGRHQAGGDGGHGGQATPPEDLSLFQYFSSSCYSGFNDGPRGFYTVYGKVFMDLASQEAYAAEKISNKQAHAAPGFGEADSLWSHVSAFYQYWLHFVSDRSFAWADIHNPASAPNRKVRRLMEDDNNKQRKAARREFQDNVRALVAFVRKRDVRVIAWMEQEVVKKAEHKAAEARRREEESAERMRRALEYEEPDWVRAADAASCSSEGDAFTEDELYCIACDKFFKSDKALANHKRSKKHLQNTEILQAALAEEEAETTPFAPEQCIHIAMRNPQASQTDVTNLQAANHEAWQVELEDQLIAGPGAGDASKSTSRSASIHGSPHQPVVEMSTASLTSVTSSESPQEDEDASLARMVQAHMQLSSCNMQKEQMSAPEGGLAPDTHGPASMLSLARSAHVDAQGPSTEQVDASHGSKTGGILQNTGAGARVTDAYDQRPHSQEETFLSGSQILSASGPKQQANAIGGEAGQPGLTVLTGQTYDDTDEVQKLSMRRKGKSRSARKKGARVEGKPLNCQVCNEAFDTRNLLFRHINEQGHGRTVVS